MSNLEESTSTAAAAAAAEEEEEQGLGNMFAHPDDERGPKPPPVPFQVARPHHPAAKPLHLLRSPEQHSLWGNELWNAARYFIERLDQGTLPVAGRTVLELGAGLGAPSLVAAACGARLVAITDFDEPAVLDLLKQNVDANKAAVLVERAERIALAKATKEERATAAQEVSNSEAPAAPKGPSRVPAPLSMMSDVCDIHVNPLLWGSNAHMQTVLQAVGGTGYDVLILSDVVFNHMCHDALLRTVSRCLAKLESSVAYVVFSHHRARFVDADLAFFEKAKDYGLKAELTDTRHDFPLMYPNDPGDPAVRKPVYCYTLTHVFDDAGQPTDDAEVDVVVLGTGFVESMVSAAAATNGLKVLHLEGRGVYGGALSGAPNVEQFERIAQESADEGTFRSSVSSDVEGGVASAAFRGFNIDLMPLQHLASGPTLDTIAGSQISHHLELQNVTRMVVIDGTAPATAPKVAPVPLSRRAVFASKEFGRMEMRRLVSFVQDLTAFMPAATHEVRDKEIAASSQPEGATADTTIDEAEKNEPNEGSEDASAIAAVRKMIASLPAAVQERPTLADLFAKYKLAARTQELLTLDGQIVAPDRIDAFTGARTLQQLVASVGRYGGQTPFLVHQYGSGEIAQLFCRATALWDGVFVLRRSVALVEGPPIATSNPNVATSGSAVAVQPGVFRRPAVGEAVVLSNGQRIKSKCVVLPQRCVQIAAGSDKPPSAVEGEEAAPVARAVLLRRGAGLPWEALEAQAPSEEDQEEQQVRRFFKEPLVVGSVRLSVPSSPSSSLPSSDNNPSSSSSSRRIVTASVLQLSNASYHAAAGCTTIHVSAPLSEVSPEDLLDAAVAVFASRASPAAAADGEGTEEGASCDTPLMYQACFALSADRIARTTLLGREPLTVPRAQLADVSGTASATVALDDTAASGVPVIPVRTFFAGSINDRGYVEEARRAFEQVRLRCGLSAAESPFLVKPEEGEEDTDVDEE